MCSLYDNPTHKAIHVFFLTMGECKCEYGYFPQTLGVGFEIGGERRPKAYLILDDASGSAVLAMEYAGLLGKDKVDLEIADPDFFTKIIDFLKSNGLDKANHCG